MEYKWLNKAENKKVIVFFNGWGMDESAVKHLEYENFDILMFYNYTSLGTSFDFHLLDLYEKRYLVAWSMGVMTATLFNIQYTSSTAVNGTLKPIDNNFGIPERIYNLTLKGFNQKVSEQFIKNMFNEACDLPSVGRTVENQRLELEALKNYTADMNFKYQKVIISSEDKIIPSKNQTAFWGIEPNIVSGHSPFNKFKTWKELL